MRSPRVAWIAAVLAAACGEAATPAAGPLDRVYLPTGLAVHHPAGGDARLVVASSNADLFYDDVTGGAVLSIDPAGAGTTRGLNIRSFAGELALATPAFPDPASPDPAACGTAVPGPLALVATRGSDTLNAVLLGADGLSCHHCGVPIGGTTFGDPFAVAVACRDADQAPPVRRARAFVGHLRSFTGEARITEYDLDSGGVRTFSVGAGPPRGFAYDVARDRLYVVGLAGSTPTPLRWVELRDCRVDLPRAAGGCSVGETTFPSLPPGIELRSIALAHPVPGQPQRAFLTARLYDTVSAALVGGRTVDYGGLLVVADLVENALGGVDAEVVWTEELGRGAQDVRVLPSRGPGRRDVVAALSVDDGVLWIYDDESHVLKAFGRRPDTGTPLLGHEPFGLAADPLPAADPLFAGSVARLYVGSFRESFVAEVEVPLEAPDAAFVVTTAPNTPRRITGGTP